MTVGPVMVLSHFLRCINDSFPSAAAAAAATAIRPAVAGELEV